LAPTTEADTVNEDLVVDDNDDVTITNFTYVNGSIIVKDNGKLTISDTTGPLFSLAT
jgi:hypothetical protein